MTSNILRFVLILVSMSIPVLTNAGEIVSYDPNHLIRSVEAKRSIKCSTAAPSALIDALCRSDTQAICSQIKSFNGNQPSSQAIRAKALSTSRQEIADLSVAMGKALTEEVAPQELQQVAQRYVKIVKSVYDTIGDEYLARGKKVQDIESRIELLKKDLLARVEKYPSFHGTSAKEVVQKVTLLTPAHLENANVDTVLGYYTICGADGLVDNAFYEASTHSLVVCPGSLLATLQIGGRPEILDETIGHELGHSVGPDKYHNEDQSFQEAYKDFRSCLDSHDLLEFASLANRLNLLKKRIPYLENCLNLLKQETPVPQDKFAYVNSAISSYQDKVESINYRFRVNLSNAMDPVATHMNELTADFMGAETMADKITEIPVDQRAHYVATNLEPYCSELEPMAQEIIAKDCASAQPQFTSEEAREWWSGDDGRHPSKDYRLRAHLHHPGIRKALGCQALPVDDPHPWCSLSAPKPTEK